jgi:hypothetical protein
MQLQMADQSIRFSEGIARDVMVKIQDHYAPADFMVLDMGEEILGRPFLNTTNTAIIYVGSGQVHFQFSEEKICCYFNSYTTYKHPKNRSRRRRQSSCCQENQTLWNEWEESKEPEEPMKDEPTPPKSSSQTNRYGKKR